MTGYDADIIIWDSHPLAIGATPKQVFIDGVAQIEDSFTAEKPEALQQAPKTPNFDKETADTIEYDGLPPLEPEVSTTGTVVFANVSDVYIRNGDSIELSFSASSTSGPGAVVVRSGKIICAGTESTCLVDDLRTNAIIRDLAGGSVA